MDLLEGNVFAEFKKVYDDFVEELERAEKEGDGVDLKNIIKSQSKITEKLNTHFRECKIRLFDKGKKKRGWM